MAPKTRKNLTDFNQKVSKDSLRMFIYWVSTVSHQNSMTFIMLAKSFRLQKLQLSNNFVRYFRWLVQKYTFVSCKKNSWNSLKIEFILILSQELMGLWTTLSKLMGYMESIELMFLEPLFAALNSSCIKLFYWKRKFSNNVSFGMMKSIANSLRQRDDGNVLVWFFPSALNQPQSLENLVQRYTRIVIAVYLMNKLLEIPYRLEYNPTFEYNPTLWKNQ